MKVYHLIVNSERLKYMPNCNISLTDQIKICNLMEKTFFIFYPLSIIYILTKINFIIIKNKEKSELFVYE